MLSTIITAKILGPRIRRDDVTSHSLQQKPRSCLRTRASMLLDKTKHFLKLGLFTIALTLFSVTAIAEIDPPVTSSLEPATAHSHNFLLEMEIEDGWKVYGPYPGDDGKPLEIIDKDSHNLTNLQVMWPPTEHLDGVDRGNDVYHGKIAIPLLAQAQNPKDKISLRLHLNLVACKDVCISINHSLFAQGNAMGGEEITPSLIIMILFAIIGGFILNLMPCVLPVVTLKAYSIVKCAGKSESHIRLSALLTVLGIITTFVGLALVVVSVRTAGVYIGWGFHFQHPGFLIFLTIILFISAMVLRGDLNISLPSILPGTGNGHMASFLSGVLTTILATPCTAPFITPVVAFALTQQTMTIILLYSSIGLGMAAPFLLVAIYPKTIRALPRPGPWMDRLKMIFSLLMILTVVWLLYILLSQVGMKSIVAISGGLILLKFFLVRFKSWKGAIAAIIIASVMLSIPKLIYEQDKAQEELANKYWEPFSQTKLDNYIAHGDIVFVDVTADWCLLCKINKLLISDNTVLLEFLQMHDVKLMRADLTSPSKDIMMYMKKNNRNAIPFNIMYGPKSPHQIVLPEFLTAQDVKNAMQTLQK